MSNDASANEDLKTERPLPAIFGCLGEELTEAERDYFATTQPFGFILMGRNCVAPGQVRRLTTELRALLRHDNAPIFIDQEGGRVARLKPPRWPKLPAAGVIGAIYRHDTAMGIEAAGLVGALIGQELWQLGISVNCAPVLDLAHSDMHEVIGDRAFGADPMTVTALSRAYAEGLLGQGVLPVIKHLPGHGRVGVDPHYELPVVALPPEELMADFMPFKQLAAMPLGMTSHILFTAIDPNHPASQSATIIDRIIRREIGFDGLLLSDDLDMKALKGDLLGRAQQVLDAGTDVILICNSGINELSQIGTLLPQMSEASWQRWERAQVMVGAPEPFNVTESNLRLDMLMAAVDFTNQMNLTA